MSNDPTNFNESNALLYIQMGDEEAAQDILDNKMLPGELIGLKEAAGRLKDMCLDTWWDRRAQAQATANDV